MGDTELKLPPCKVCGSKASGSHFGVISCEACKAFYKRSQSRDRPYPCRGEVEGACEVKAGKTLMCPHCRLLKCTSLGMSRQGINRGRVPIERKAELLLEAMEYQQRKKQQGPKTENLTDETLASKTFDIPRIHSGGSSEFNGSIFESNGTCDLSNYDSGISACGSVGSNSESCGSPERLDDQINMDAHIDGHDDFIDMLMNQDSLLSEPGFPGTANISYDANYLEWFIQVIYQADMTHPLHEKEEIEQAVAAYDKYVESRRVKEELMGPLPPMAPEVYNEIYNATGIDLDDYRAKPASVIKVMETHILIFTRFLKELPGFQDLNINDKVTYAKGGFTGWVMLSSLVMHRLDSETGYLTKMCGAGEAWTNDDAARYFGAETFKMMMDNMTAIFVKHFSPQALAVLKMLNIYTERPECGVIEDKVALAANQQLVREALLYQLKKDNIEDVAKEYEDIMAAMQGLDDSVLAYGKVIRTWPTEFPEHQYPKIFKEMIGTETEELIKALTQLNISS